MDNRAHIEFYELYEDSEHEGLSALLYVANDGQPGKMGVELDRALKEARELMEKMGKIEEWAGERVASLLIATAARKEGYGVMPRYRSCVSWVAVEYLWKVYLGPKPGAYRIACFEVDNSGRTGLMDKVTKVDWEGEERA